MTFWEHFFCLLPRRPLKEIAALYWHVTRRKVRARNRLRQASADLPFAYRVWVSINETRAHPAPGLGGAIEGWAWQPRFSVLLHGPTGTTQEEQLGRSIGSLERQIYSSWKIFESTEDPLAVRVASADGDYLVPLRVGDTLPEMALFRFAEALQSNRRASLVYGDQDQLDAAGRRTRPWFKPRWNQEMFLAQDYLSAAVAIEMGLAQGSAARLDDRGRDDLAALMLGVTSAAKGPIIHLPYVLCHVGADAEDMARSGRIDAVRRHLRPLGATCSAGPFGTVKVEWPLPPVLPLVSIIVPTKDRLDLLRPCIESVLRNTDYDNFEVVVVDNASVEAPTAVYLAEVAKTANVRVLTYPGPYNFSAINNFAAAQCRGSYLCLLNNDTEVLEPSWLTEMMRYAVRPEVGAAGAKLLYEDGSIQHAGVVVGIGEAAGHAHRFLPANEQGYFAQAHIAQFVSAVTAACLVVEKRKFEAVGGLDEKKLAIAFNDVDFCLKLEAAGWRNVYVPHAILLHHESKSRGSDAAPKNIERYMQELHVLQTRWGTKTYEDALHNPNLDRYSETFLFRI